MAVDVGGKAARKVGRWKIGKRRKTRRLMEREREGKIKGNRWGGCELDRKRKGRSRGTKAERARRVEVRSGTSLQCSIAG